MRARPAFKLTDEKFRALYRATLSKREYIAGNIGLEEMRGYFTREIDQIVSDYLDDLAQRFKQIIQDGKQYALNENALQAALNAEASNDADEVATAKAKLRDHMDYIVPLYRDMGVYGNYLSSVYYLAGEGDSKKALDECVREIGRALKKIKDSTGATLTEMRHTAERILFAAVAEFYGLYHKQEALDYEALFGVPAGDNPEEIRAFTDKIQEYSRKAEEWADYQNLLSDLLKILDPIASVVNEAMGIAWAPPRKTTKARETAAPRQLSIWDGWENMGYLPMLQSPGYNAFIRALGAPTGGGDLLGRRTIKRNNLTVSLTGLPDSIKRLPTSAAKLLDMFQIKATQSGLSPDNCVFLPFNEYVERRSLRDRKEARNQIKRDLELLQGVDIRFNDKNEGWLNVSLSGGTRGLTKGMIVFKYNDTWLKLFPIDNQIMPIPKGLFATNDKANPHSYYFGRVIFEHRRMNDGKKNECIISVKTLVCASPTFPTYESLGEAKQVDKRIIEPFNRDMQAATDATEGKFYWEYSGRFTDIEPDKYDDFINAKIHITWNQYPNTETIKKGRAKYKTMADKLKLTGQKGVTGRSKGGNR